MENYQLNLLALGFVIHQGDARVRRRWYKESGANFETIEDYLYDESGRLAKTIETDEWFQCVYAYDDRGRIIRTTHGPQNQDEPNPPTIYEYQYDETGRVFLEFSYFEDYENPDTELTFQFDKQGRVTSMHKRYFNTSDGSLGIPVISSRILGCERAAWGELMPVQARAIPYLLARRNMMIQARTGSGKTGAFLPPMLQRLQADRAECQALILVPTRELAKQIHEEDELPLLAMLLDDYYQEALHGLVAPPDVGSRPRRPQKPSTGGGNRRAGSGARRRR